MPPKGLSKLNPWHKFPVPERAESTSPSSPPQPPSSEPDSHLPKRRPPRLLRDKLTRSLPQYTGPYTVGVIELEIPVPQPRSISRLSREGKPVLQLRTVLFNLYYPAALGTGEGRNKNKGVRVPHVHLHNKEKEDDDDEEEGGSSKEKKHGRPRWLSAPVRQIGKGYAAYSEMPAWLTTAWFGGLTGFTRLPAWRNAQIATHVPGSPAATSAENEGSNNETTTPAANGAGAGVTGREENPKFPLLVFSHGLGGTRTTYSSVCGEFASYGYVVVAIEHRDGSGPLTFVNYENELQREKEEAKGRRMSSRSATSPNTSSTTPKLSGTARPNGTTHANGSANTSNHGIHMPPPKAALEKLLSRLSRQETMYDLSRTSTQPLPPGTGEDTVTYVWPKHPHDDTKDYQDVDTTLRRAQVEMRKMEIKEALHILREINSGNADAVVYRNKRVKPDKRQKKKAQGIYGIDDVDWGRWEGRIDMKQVTAAGHSFGAVTTVEVLRYRENIFPGISQGIIYDPWGAAVIQHSNIFRDRTVDVPLLCVNSESFMHWESNFSSLVPVVEESLANGCDSWMCTIRGSIHINQSDFALLYPRTCSLLLKMTVNPRRCLDVNHNISMEFLRRCEEERIRRSSMMNGGSRRNSKRGSVATENGMSGGGGLSIPQRMFALRDDADTFLDTPITGQDDTTDTTTTVTTEDNNTAEPTPLSHRTSTLSTTDSRKLQTRLSSRTSTIEKAELSLRSKTRIKKITSASKRKGSKLFHAKYRVPEHIYTKKKAGRFVDTNEVWMHLNPSLKKHTWKEEPRGGVVRRAVKTAVGEVADKLRMLSSDDVREEKEEEDGAGQSSGESLSTGATKVNGSPSTTPSGRINGGPPRSSRNSFRGNNRKVKRGGRGAIVKGDGEVMKVAMRSREMAAGDGYVALMPDVGIKVEEAGGAS